MELNDAMRMTFSSRDFTGETIPDDVLYEILDNARFAPSGGNRQGNRVVIVRDAETREALAKLAEPAAKRYTAQVKRGESPWNTINPTAVTDAEIEKTPPASQLTDSFRKADVVLVFFVDLSVVASMDQFLDRVGVISGGSIYPFVWNVLLGARQAGYGGTITTLAAAMESDVQKLLGAPSNYAVAAVVPMGKPHKMLTKLRRNPVEDIATVGRFEGPAFSK